LKPSGAESFRPSPVKFALGAILGGYANTVSNDSADNSVNKFS